MVNVMSPVGEHEGAMASSYQKVNANILNINRNNESGEMRA